MVDLFPPGWWSGGFEAVGEPVGGVRAPSGQHPAGAASSRPLASAADRPPVSPVRSASLHSRPRPACATTPVPAPVTSSRRYHAIAFTRNVLPEPEPVGPQQSLIVPVQE